MEYTPVSGGRMPPYNLEAERSVLGAMMLDSQSVIMAIDMLAADDFYHPAHKEMFDAVCELNRLGMSVDLVTMDEILSRRGTLDGIGGAGYLVEISRFVPTTANSADYMAIVLEKSTLRKLIRASQEISDKSYEASEPVADILSFSEKSIFDISLRKTGEDALQHIHPVLLRTYDQINELYQLKGQISGVPSGFTDLDRLTTGFHPGELILIGARPSMGKTSIAMNLVENAALTADKKIAVFSLEMPREQLAMRMLCAEARVDMQSVRLGDLNENDWLQITEAIGPLSKAGIYLDDTAGISTNTIRSRCRRLMLERGLDMIIIDYLQLMTSDNKRIENRQNEISDISRALKGLAKELNIPVVACAQLSRAAASRSDHRPILSDLRDSGAIEQDADVVMFLHREDYYNPDTPDKNIAELIIAKQRNGPLGTVKLAWMAQYTRFLNFGAPGA